MTDEIKTLLLRWSSPSRWQRLASLGTRIAEADKSLSCEPLPADHELALREMAIRSRKQWVEEAYSLTDELRALREWALETKNLRLMPMEWENQARWPAIDSTTSAKSVRELHDLTMNHVASGEVGAFLPCPDLAKKNGVEEAALDQRLRRWREKNDTGWIENANPKKGEPRYLYLESSVQAIIDSLKT